MFPTQSKIELFARHRYDGWDVWGLEAARKLTIAERRERMTERENACQRKLW